VVVDEIVYGYYYDEFGKKTNYTFHHDHLRSVVGLTAHEGSTVETTKYGAFGEEISSSGTSENFLKYTGREHDEDTGLYYYRARYYDPEVGRFLTEDPIGFDGGINFYTYAQNNPVNFNDPMGHDVVTSGFKFEVAGWAAQIVKKAYEITTGDVNDFTVTGLGLGVALSFPGLSGGEWDFGAYFTADVNSANIPALISKLGIAKGSREFGYKVGSVRNLRDTTQFEASAQVGLYGGGVEWSYDKAAMEHYVSGVKFSYGPGAIAGVSATPTTAISVRDIGAWFNGGNKASGGFVLYPNKPNTNMMQQVYAK